MNLENLLNGLQSLRTPADPNVRLTPFKEFMDAMRGEDHTSMLMGPFDRLPPGFELALFREQEARSVRQAPQARSTVIPTVILKARSMTPCLDFACEIL